MSRHAPAARQESPVWESWTEIADVGDTFNGIPLTLAEYVSVESAYVSAALRFAFESGVEVLEIPFVGSSPPGFGVVAGHRVPRSDLGALVRANLRAELDCTLRGIDGGFEVSFGYDLYMYVASNNACQHAVVETQRSGLYVETGVAPPHWESDPATK
ncbi:hypothetical protein [Patulibacter defluvii]|uniref:hypothetical protein n=1 Tax=Patulibacter defluvii TaxID=3095358 RepID=UPI002A74B2BC|nr:hypothetical protein [Patulibacter sp. DM4]